MTSPSNVIIETLLYNEMVAINNKYERSDMTAEEAWWAIQAAYYKANARTHWRYIDIPIRYRPLRWLLKRLI